jgi:replicative DNA helicase
MTDSQTLRSLGFEGIDESVKEAERQVYNYQNGIISPLQTFSAKMNEKIMFLPGDTVVFAGRSGVGKSAWANNFLRSLHTLNNDVLTLYFSHEMESWRQIMRMYSKAVKESVSDLLIKKFDQGAFDRLKQIGEELKEYEMYFKQSPVSPVKFEELITKVRDLFPDKRIVIVYDHTRLVRSNQRSEEAKITELMEMASYCNLKHHTFNVFLSQMNRNIETGDDGGDRAPLSSDIFGSDAVMQFADHVIALHRPEMYHISKFKYGGYEFDTDHFISAHVIKQRDGWTGMIPYNHNLKHNDIWDRQIEKQTKFKVS